MWSLNTEFCTNTPAERKSWDTEALVATEVSLRDHTRTIACIFKAITSLKLREKNLRARSHAYLDLAMAMLLCMKRQEWPRQPSLHVEICYRSEEFQKSMLDIASDNKPPHLPVKAIQLYFYIHFVQLQNCGRSRIKPYRCHPMSTIITISYRFTSEDISYIAVHSCGCALHACVSVIPFLWLGGLRRSWRILYSIRPKSLQVLTKFVSRSCLFIELVVLQAGASRVGVVFQWWCSAFTGTIE